MGGEARSRPPAPGKPGRRGGAGAWPTLLAAAISLSLLPAVAPLAGQEPGVSRRSFTFLGSRLLVAVQDSAPGVVRLIRGEGGEIRVAARARGGFATMGLETRGTDRLNLTSAGARRVEYLVVVPEEVHVRVRLPGRATPERFSTLTSSATYEWEAASAPATEAAPPPVAEDPPTRETPFLAYENARAPALVTVPGVGDIRSLTVRIEGDRFRLTSSRPLSVTPGRREAISVEPGEPVHLAIVLPGETRHFTLRLGDATALEVDEGEAEALCSPVTTQRLGDGSRWFTFTPEDGALTCR